MEPLKAKSQERTKQKEKPIKATPFSYKHRLTKMQGKTTRFFCSAGFRLVICLFLVISKKKKAHQRMMGLTKDLKIKTLPTRSHQKIKQFTQGKFDE